MSLTERNIAANFGGNVWTGVVGLIFVPLYIRFMGIEAYGLVGVFLGLQALFALLDMGLSNTLNREMARLSTLQGKAQEMRDLVRSLEVPYWAAGLTIACVVALAAPLIAYHWVNAEELAPRSIHTAIMVMGLCIAFRWPLNLYSGGLMGLQYQVLLNLVNATAATLQALGAVLVLWLVSPSVVAFFLWQAAISFCHTGLVAFFFRRSLPIPENKPRFRFELIRSIWRFTAGITGTTMLAAVLTQTDKIILSRLLTMEMFGYYTLAHMVAMTIYRFVYPISSAVYPRLTNLVASGNDRELRDVYHKSAQLVSVLALSAAAVVSLFAEEIILLWTQNVETTAHSHLLVSLLVAGTALNGLMTIPYTLQLASGWTMLAFWVNLVSVLVLIPLMIVLTRYFGAPGAAGVWVILNAGYLLFAVQVMHRRLLPTEKWRWYLQDVAFPLGVALSVAFLFRITIPPAPSNIVAFGYLFVVSASTLSITAMAAPTVRGWVRL